MLADPLTGDASLDGRRILVTGGTTGIGRATVKRLAGAGAKILTFGRHQPELDDALRNAGLPPEAGLTADASTREGVAGVFEAVDERLGGIDILVACAALGANPLHEMADDDWRYVVETNLIGYLACARAAIQRMDAAGGGQLLFVGSISPEIKAPGESVYAATKGGIHAFAETLRKEVAEKNIKVSLIAPGSTGSDMQECSVDEQQAAIDRQEMLYAEEIAEAILFALTRSERCDVVSLRIEPRLQKTA
ncbi:SDR family oxidoreductase [Sphingomonas sp. SRS2]|uniref:SDR family oxidoreductase n=1 Tax=Sphingomonas sp. SRS2 TaxID=133190 RepID=UPI0006183FE5|nr:SDR family oxidoreductase [Sphingomonas sp. SRS2]KKC24645.1 oxidoreductase [Sphingomonas sp. SRS2]